MTLSWFQRYGWKANIPWRANLSSLSKICNHFGEITAWSRKSLTIIIYLLRFLGKKTPYRQIFTNLFQRNSPRLRTKSCVQISWNLADRKSAKSCVIYLTKKQNFRKLSRSWLCADRAQNLSGPAPNNILGVPQISSKSVHFRRSYRKLIVQTRHKVFPILGKASSPSNHMLPISGTYINDLETSADILAFETFLTPMPREMYGNNTCINR